MVKEFFSVLGAGAYGLERALKLLEANPSLAHARDIDGSTTLQVAAYSGEPAIVEALLNRGADLQAEHAYGGPALHSAASAAAGTIDGRLEKYVQTITLLIARGADPDKRDSRGRVPLAGAVSGQRNSISIVKLLLRHGADAKRLSDPDLDSILHYAAQEGLTETVAWLVAYGLDPDAPNQSKETPLHRAGLDNRARKAAKLEVLLAKSASVDARDFLGKTPLMVVCRDRSHLWSPPALLDILSAVHILLAHGANVNAQADGGSTPLHAAVVANNPELIKFLVSQGADMRLSPKAGTPLHLAINHRYRESIEALLAAGANIEERSDDFSPLETAIFRHDWAIVDLLIQRGANVNTRNRSGQSPLRFARRENLPEIADRLIAAGANP